MVAKRPVPTLSLSGWVNSVAEKADYLLAHFFEADAFQTSIYPGHVASLPWLLETYGKDRFTLQVKMQENLARYLGRYFTSVVPTVEVVDDEEDASKWNIKLHCTFVDEGKEYSLGKLVAVTGNQIKQVVRLNN